MYQLFLYTSAYIIRDLHTRARAHTHRPYGEMSSLRCIGSRHHPNRHKITASEGHYLDILQHTALSSAESWRGNAYRRPPHRSTLVNSHEIALGDPAGSAGAAQGSSRMNTQLDGSGKKTRQNRLSGIVSFSKWFWRNEGRGSGLPTGPGISPAFLGTTLPVHLLWT